MKKFIIKKCRIEIYQLCKYAPTKLAVSRARINQFMMGASDLEAKECHTEMLVGDMDISHLIVYAQQTEDSKVKEQKSKDKKRSKIDDDKSYNYGFNGCGHFTK